MGHMQGVPVDMQADGLLWMINRTVFHPHGFALGIVPATGEFVLYGDGVEPWEYGLSPDVETVYLAAFKSAMKRAEELPDGQRST